MNRIPCAVCILSAVLLLGAVTVAHAGGEVATFASFYKEPWRIGWIVALASAVIAAALIVATGGTASPIVVTIGTFIGNLAGFTGIAATNYGLALLGGGSLASGGFGMLGGAVVLTAALSFSTDMVVDVGANYALTEWSYSRFVESSRQMNNLPAPVNTDGPEPCAAAMKMLEALVPGTSLFTDENQETIARARQAVTSQPITAFDADEKARIMTIRSLLSYLNLDYPAAHDEGLQAIRYARDANLRRTLPAFIVAVASLHQEEFDYQAVVRDYFRYAVLAEPENKLVPLLYAVFLDRVGYLMQTGRLDAQAFHPLAAIAADESLADQAYILHSILTARYAIAAKYHQQVITALTGSSDPVIRTSVKTLARVQASLAEYRKLVTGFGDVVTAQLSIATTDEELVEQQRFLRLFSLYRMDTFRLERLVTEYEQVRMNEQPPGAARVQPAIDMDATWLHVGLFCACLGAAIITLCRRRNMARSA